MGYETQPALSNFYSAPHQVQGEQMNRYRTYLDEKPKPPKKPREQLAAEVEAFLAAGKQVAQVPRGASAWNAGIELRPKERSKT